MVAENNIIVAFEFGSSAIRGVAGKKESDGTIRILALEQERISDSIRRGTVRNLNKTTSAIQRIKERLNQRLDVRIARAYVGIAGQSLHTKSNKVARAINLDEKITSRLVDQLMDENRSTHYPEREILDVAPQEYTVGNEKTSEPVGIQADKIEGHYLNIIARTKLQDNIRACMRDAGLEIVELLITPIELAKALLTESETRAGCALVDIGAETTTVSIFTKNILRHLATIPLGSNNATMDLSKLVNVEMEEAELLKTRYGVAVMSHDKEATYQTLDISNDRKVSEKDIQLIVSARYSEIVVNVWNQITKDRWEDNLLSGITLTGGGSDMQELTEAFMKLKPFQNQFPYKIKQAKKLTSITKIDEDTMTIDPGFNAVIAMLMSATENCIGEDPEPEEETIVEEEAQPDPVEEVAEENTTEKEPEVVKVAEGETEGEIPTGKKKKKFWGKMGEWLKDLVNEDE